MGGRRDGARLLSTALVAAVVVLSGGGTALARNPGPPVVPPVPTPAQVHPLRPPQGEAPDGSTVGGNRLATRGIVVTQGAPPLPADIAAPSWLVADADTGDVLAARDPHGRFYPASTIKTLTLLTLLPVLDPRQVVVGTVEDENIDGTRVGLVAGGRYPVQLLYESLILASGNDAANALARAAGGQRTTLAAMNETAEALGAFDTVAGTPSGLDAPGQSSSVYDLALIFRALLADRRAVEILRTPTAQMPAVAGRSAGYQIQNKNPLRTYPGNLGGKTGFTQAARHGFVTAAERGGRRLIVSVLGSEPVPLRAAEQAARLLDWGFSVRAGTDGIGRLIRPWEADALTRPPATTGRDDPSAVPYVAGTLLSADPADPPAPGPSADPTVAPVLLVVIAAGLLGGAVVVGRRMRRPVTAAAAEPVPVASPDRVPPDRPDPATRPGPRSTAPGSTPRSPSTPP